MRAKKITFWANWFESAENRSSDEKELAFYRALFRYAFLGIEPKRPEKGVSTGEEWAARDAYLMAANIIDADLKAQEMGEFGKKGGRPKKPKKGGGYENGNHPENQGVIENGNHPPFMNSELLNNECMNGELCEDDSHSRRSRKPTLEQVVRVGVDDQEIPEEFCRRWYAEMVRLHWQSARGTVGMRNWVAVLRAWWRREKEDAAGGSGPYQQDGYDGSELA